MKSRNIISPMSRKDYVTIPLPLGFNVLLNIGRKAVEMLMHDDPTSSRGRYLGEMALNILDSFYPLGASENLP